MKSAKILIVEEEIIIAMEIQMRLEEMGHKVISIAKSAREGVEMASELRPDLVLTEIMFHGSMDGLEAARHLAGFEIPPAVIFCTAYDEHALAAFEARAVDYLVKPVRAERLQAALQRAERLSIEERRGSAGIGSQGQRRTHLCARVRGNLRLVPVTEVIYLLAEDKYVVVHGEHGEVLIEESLKSLEQEFADQFVRIHRNCLIALDRLLALERDPAGTMHARLRGADRALEISRRCLPEVRALAKHQ